MNIINPNPNPILMPQEQKIQETELNLRIINELSNLLHNETYYNYGMRYSHNRLDLNENENKIIKSKLIEYINKL